MEDIEGKHGVNHRLTDDAEMLSLIEVIRQSLEDAKFGRVQPMRKCVEDLAAKHGIFLER